VTIDGGKRTIELAQPGTLITVKTGVTLTLRNITIIGVSDNLYPLVHEDGGRVIYETGVSTFNEKLPLSNSRTKGGSGIDLIRTETPGSGSLTVTLDPGTEVVSLDDTADIGTGLVLDNSNSPAEVTIIGSGRTIQLDGNTNGSIITVGDGVTLTLRNITFKGSASNNRELIRVHWGGTLVMENGAVITGNGRYGVYVGNNSTFNMNGGTISSNTGVDNGGGVYVDGGGTFNMSGGTISGNTAKYNGSGVYVFDSTFNMSDGTISGNTAVLDGGGVFVYFPGTYNMSGGTISGNTAARAGGGVYVLYSSFTKTTGVIYGYTPGDSKSNLVGTRKEDGTPVATQGSTKGDAVYYEGFHEFNYRDRTLGDNDSFSSAAGPWDN
jgi:parallel beta-helix repeat protein